MSSYRYVILGSGDERTVIAEETICAAGAKPKKKVLGNFRDNLIYEAIFEHAGIEIRRKSYVEYIEESVKG